MRFDELTGPDLMRARQHLGLSRRRFAQMAGINRETLGKLERSSCRLDARSATLRQLTGFLEARLILHPAADGAHIGFATRAEMGFGDS